ncbi:MAG: hypothetical protein HUJ88_11410 [Fusobacterium necrophorum]|nr:hypothetical protein [Fusobacterium necrophorum]
MTKKELMIKAHKMAKEIKNEYPTVDYKFQLGLCLSYLLNNKEQEDIMIKDWFETKLQSEFNGGHLVEVDAIERETEKSYLLRMTWGYHSTLERTVRHWVPKSATMTRTEYEKEREQEWLRFEAGMKYNQLLLAFAKENKVKGTRKGMRTATLINKIQGAGLTVPAK